jgi:hypothetical protein
LLLIKQSFTFFFIHYDSGFLPNKFKFMRSNSTRFDRQILGFLLVLTIFIQPCFRAVLAASPMKALRGNNIKKPDRKISGKVTSKQDGASVAGVNVVIKGTQRGTSTDAEGMYTIDVPGDNSVLVFSFVGYEVAEAVIGNRSVVDIALIASAESLNEVVVTALGIKREERSLGYNVGKVEGKELTKVVQDVWQA